MGAEPQTIHGALAMRASVRRISFGVSRMRTNALVLFLAAAFVSSCFALEGYKEEIGIVYCTVDGKELKLNAFLPEGIDKPAPVMVDIHGGWWSAGAPATTVQRVAG